MLQSAEKLHIAALCKEHGLTDATFFEACALWEANVREGSNFVRLNWECVCKASALIDRVRLEGHARKIRLQNHEEGRALDVFRALAEWQNSECPSVAKPQPRLTPEFVSRATAVMKAMELCREPENATQRQRALLSVMLTAPCASDKHGTNPTVDVPSCFQLRPDRLAQQLSTTQQAISGFGGLTLRSFPAIIRIHEAAFPLMKMRFDTPFADVLACQSLPCGYRGVVTPIQLRRSRASMKHKDESFRTCLEWISVNHCAVCKETFKKRPHRVWNCILIPNARMFVSSHDVVDESIRIQRFTFGE